ncbi:hypothetical protein GGI21_005970 [Coemansia aciculifera]|nr:hypothetical protein GGI21_005970 [Coemansia aciculifera]
MLSANSIATPPRLPLGSHYVAQPSPAAGTTRQAYDARAASTADASPCQVPQYPDSSSAALAATLAAAMASATSGSSGHMQTMSSADMASGYGDGRGGWANNSVHNAFVDSRPGGSVVAPRAASVHHLPPWMYMFDDDMATAVDWSMGASAYYHQGNVINDVFFTPEERPQSPQLTPVSDTDDSRLRPMLPCDGLESFDPCADLALFAAESRLGWGADEIETTSMCSSSTRHASPTPTISAYNDSDDDDFSAKFLHPLSAHVAAQTKLSYSW